MKKIIAVISCLLLAFTCASAHSGRTDSAGGHWNRSTGEYHYHHGYPAHQHPGGVCPYDYDDQTGASSGSSSAAAPVEPAYDEPVAASMSESQDTSSESEEIDWRDPSWEWVPDEYAYVEDYTMDYPLGSHVLMRRYYYDESGYMYTPYRGQEVPHGAAETDNTDYLEAGSYSSEADKPKFDYYTLDEIVYQFGLQDQSLQFQQGALFAFNEAYLLNEHFSESENEESEIQPTQKEYPYERDDGTYETAYNVGYTTGCAELIEINSELLPDVSQLTGELSENNRLSGSTTLEAKNATFESAFDDGYYQSETDFYTALNDLVGTGVSSDEADEIYDAAYNQGVSDTQKEYDYVLPVLCMLLLVVILTFVYYRNKANNTRS